MSDAVHFSAAVSAIHPTAPKAFHAKVLCDTGGITIRDLRGRQRAHYAWTNVRGVRLRTSDQRMPNYVGGAFSFGSLFTMRAAWWDRQMTVGAGTLASERMSAVRRTATLEITAPDGVWFLRVYHRQPYQVTEALRPFVHIDHVADQVTD